MKYSKGWGTQLWDLIENQDVHGRLEYTFNFIHNHQHKENPKPKNCNSSSSSKSSNSREYQERDVQQETFSAVHSPTVWVIQVPVEFDLSTPFWWHHKSNSPFNFSLNFGQWSSWSCYVFYRRFLFMWKLLNLVVIWFQFKVPVYPWKINEREMKLWNIWCHTQFCFVVVLWVMGFSNLAKAPQSNIHPLLRRLCLCSNIPCRCEYSHKAYFNEKWKIWSCLACLLIIDTIRLAVSILPLRIYK